jgi:hypothetical protein
VLLSSPDRRCWQAIKHIVVIKEKQKTFTNSMSKTHFLINNLSKDERVFNNSTTSTPPSPHTHHLTTKLKNHRRDSTNLYRIKYALSLHGIVAMGWTSMRGYFGGEGYGFDGGSLCLSQVSFY